MHIVMKYNYLQKGRIILWTTCLYSFRRTNRYVVPDENTI